MIDLQLLAVGTHNVDQFQIAKREDGLWDIHVEGERGWNTGLTFSDLNSFIAGFRRGVRYGRERQALDALAAKKTELIDRLTAQGVDVVALLAALDARKLKL